MTLPITIDADKIITLTLEPNQGPMCILDEGLIRRIDESVKALPRDAKGLILSSGSPRVFVAGADLKSIMAMSHDELERYLGYGHRVFGSLCALPYPTVAALNGAALGGGLELAMHCDGLVASPAPVINGQVKPYPIGLPEAGLKICPGWGGTNLLPARVRDIADALRRTATGKTWLVTELGDNGLIDAFSQTPESLQAKAKNWLLKHPNLHAQRRDEQPLRWIGRPNLVNQVTMAAIGVRDELGSADPAASCLRAVFAGLERGWPAALVVERQELNRLRATPEGHGAIQAFFDKTAKK